MTIIRTDTFLHWTGEGWSKKRDEAKIFPTWEAARDAIEQREPTTPPSGDQVLIVAIAGAN